jgi:hypothetical protein
MSSSSAAGGLFLTVFTTAALGAVVFYLLQRLKVTEARLTLLDQKSRQNVDVGEVKSLLRKEIPNLRRLFDGETGPPRITESGERPGGNTKTAEAPPGLTFGAAPAVQGPVRRLEEDDEHEEEKVEAAAPSPGAD